MRTVAAPDWTDREAASLAACLSGVLELPLEALDVPPDAVGIDAPLLRHWLAEQHLGLVPVQDPGTFAWAGPWLAAVPDGATGGRRWVIAFGAPAPAGVVWDPLQPHADDGPAPAYLAGYVVAGLVPGATGRPRRTPAEAVGIVGAIVVAPRAGGPATEVGRAVAVAGRGLEGDRYGAGTGTFSRPGGRGLDLTLADETHLAEAGVSAADARRNVVVRGVELDDLIGLRFRVGTAECVGRRRCEPCAHLQRLTRPGVLRALVHRGGLRADIVTGGEIAVGDTVEVLG